MRIARNHDELEVEVSRFALSLFLVMGMEKTSGMTINRESRTVSVRSSEKSREE